MLFFVPSKIFIKYTTEAGCGQLPPVGKGKEEEEGEGGERQPVQT